MVINMKVKVGISNRHVHLKQSDLDILFGKELTIKKMITQPGQFACNETVTIKTDKSEISNVRVLGPVRNYTQIEISKTDAYKLGLNPPVRTSGDLEGSEIVTIVGPKGSIKTSGCIIADRHLHITYKDKEKYNIPDKIMVKIDGIKKGIIEINVKASEEAYYEIHLDTDDANAFLLKNEDELEILDV